MRVLVTGGAGFIGSHLVELILKSGDEVVVLDNLSSGKPENLPLGVRILDIDVRNAEGCFQTLLLERPTCLVHLAAQANVRRSISDPLADIQVNVLGTVNVCRAATSAGVRRMIFASSGGAIYGDQSSYPCREESLPNPASPYGISKLAAEGYCRSIADSAGMEFTALRLANVYGPRQDPRGEAGIVAIYLEQFGLGQRPNILGDGLQTRDYVWVEDVARAFADAMRRKPGIYNIGTGRETSVLDLYDRLCRLTGYSIPPHHLPPVVGEVRRNVLSIDQARIHLGWEPTTGLDEGLVKAVQATIAKKPREFSEGRGPAPLRLGVRS